MRDGKECSLIEIEREDKALSMLILKTNRRVKWNSIYSMLLFGLVDASGKWSNYAIKKTESKGIIVFRNKYIKKSIYDRETYVYKKLL